MKAISRVLVVIVIVVIGISGFFILSSFAEEPVSNTPPVKSKKVNAIVADPGYNSAYIKTYGRMASTDPVVLTSETSGTVQKGDIDFKPGTKFKKGDLLLKIDDRQTTLAIKSLKSDFLSSLVQVLPEIKVDFPDEYSVWEEYFNQVSFEGSLKELPEAANSKIKLFLARYSIYKQYFNIKNQEILLSKHSIKAPFDGSVVEANIRVGSTANNGSRLGEIINLSSMEVEAPVKTDDLMWMDKSGEVELYSDDFNSTFKGKITRVSSSIEARTQTVPVFIKVLNTTGNSLDGLFFDVNIPGTSVESSLRIPRKALYNGDNVYLVKNGKLLLTSVKMVRGEPDEVIVTGNIAKGDTVVSDLLQGVYSGMPARVTILDTEEGGK